jgi:hypothetical protein
MMLSIRIVSDSRGRQNNGEIGNHLFPLRLLQTILNTTTMGMKHDVSVGDED